MRTIKWPVAGAVIIALSIVSSILMSGCGIARGLVSQTGYLVSSAIR